MYINAYIAFKFRIILYCELSHENFIALINYLHKNKFDTEITDAGEWNQEISSPDEEDDFTYALWADDETIDEIYKTIDRIIKQKLNGGNSI